MANISEVEFYSITERLESLEGRRSSYRQLEPAWLKKDRGFRRFAEEFLPLRAKFEKALVLDDDDLFGDVVSCSPLARDTDYEERLWWAQFTDTPRGQGRGLRPSIGDLAVSVGG